MTLQPAQKWIILLVAIVTPGSGPLLFASGEDPGDPLDPVATYGDGRFRLGGWIDSLCFSPDGKLLASSSDRGGTALWDAETGELVRHFPPVDRDAHESQVVFSPDGKLIVIAATHLHVRNVATGELVYEIENAGHQVWENRLVQFTRDGKHFLAYGRGGVLFIEAKTGRIVHKFEVDGQWDRLNGVALSPDGSRAILGTYRLLEPITEGRAIKATYAVKTWDLTSGKETLPRPPQDHFGETLKWIQFSPDGRSLLAVTGRWHFQQTLKLLDPQTLKLQRVIRTNTGVVHSHDYSLDGRLLAVATTDTQNYYIQLFNPPDSRHIRRWRVAGHGTGKGVIVAVSPDGRTIASTLERKPEITLWDAATGRNKFPHEEGRTTSVERMLILSDNRTLVTQDENRRVIRRDLKTGRITGEQVWPIPDSSMALSTDANELLISGLNRMGSEPQLKGSQLMTDVKKHKRYLQEARISANGNRVAVLYHPTRLSVYDRHTGRRLRQFGKPPCPVIPTTWFLAISANGSHVAGNYGPDRQFWNVETGEAVHGVPISRFAPDGTVMTHGGGEVLLWDIKERKRVAALQDKPHRMGMVAFTPDGKLMAHARYGERIEVVLSDFATHKKIRVLRGVRGGIQALCFSPDGRTLCASDRSTRIVVWDLSND